MRGGVFAQNYDVPTRDFARLPRHAQPRGRRAPAGACLDGAARDDLRSTDLRAAAAQTPATRTSSACATSTCRSTSAGATATPAGRGTASRSGCATGTASGCCTTRATGATSSRTGRRWALSFPGFLPSIVAKFVNASTVDGFNPYRITRDGIDWETSRPGRPLEQHRLLGRPPDRLPAASCSRRCTRYRSRRPRGRCSTRRSSATPTSPTASSPTRRSCGIPARTIDFDTDRAARDRRARRRRWAPTASC